MAIYNITSQQLKGTGILNSFEMSGVGSFINTKSLNFDGVDAYLEGSSNYTLLDGESKATISAWINLDAGNVNAAYLFAIKEIGSLNFTLGVRLQIIGVNANCKVYTQNASNVNRANISLGSIVGDGSWHHLLICLDLALTGNTEAQVFLDGVSKGIVGRFQNTTFTSVSAPLYIGHADAYNYINGNIDEFAIWAGTDLRASAATIYNSGVPNDLNNNGLTAPTTWYRMGDAATIDGNDITIPDQIGSYNLTSEGMVAADVQSDVPS